MTFALPLALRPSNIRFEAPAFIKTINTPANRLKLQRNIVLLQTVLAWAIAITFTAGKLARAGYEASRPSLARFFHALASALEVQVEAAVAEPPVKPPAPKKTGPSPTPSRNRRGKAAA